MSSPFHRWKLSLSILCRTYQSFAAQSQFAKNEGCDYEQAKSFPWNIFVAKNVCKSMVILLYFLKVKTTIKINQKQFKQSISTFLFEMRFHFHTYFNFRNWLSFAKAWQWNSCFQLGHMQHFDCAETFFSFLFLGFLNIVKILCPGSLGNSYFGDSR